MNQMGKVCKLLGVDLFEKFNIIKERPNITQKIRNPYYFTDEGMINNFYVLDNVLLADLLVGSLKIEILEKQFQFGSEELVSDYKEIPEDKGGM